MILCSRLQYHGMYAAMLLSFTSTLARYASLLTAHVVPCRTYCVGSASEGAASLQLGARETRCVVTHDRLLPFSFAC
jgi:hypothetical protein